MHVKHNNKDLSSPLPLRVRDALPSVLATYPYTSGKPANTQYPRGYREMETYNMKDLKVIDHAVVSYDIHSPYFREVVNICA